MNVSDIMSTHLVTVFRDTPVDEVAKLLVKQGIGGVPVLERNGKVVGVVTEYDLIVRNANLHLPTFLTIIDTFVPLRGQHEFKEEMRRVLATQAGEVMSEHLYTISPDADVSDAATLMMDKHVNPIPVIADGKLVGVVSRRDIVRLMVREEEAAERGEAGGR